MTPRKLTRSVRSYLQMVSAEIFNSRRTADYLRSLYHEFTREVVRAEIERQRTK